MDLRLEAVSQEVPQHDTGLIPGGVRWHCGITGESFVTDPAGPNHLVFRIVGNDEETFQCRGGKTSERRIRRRTSIFRDCVRRSLNRPIFPGPGLRQSR
jgi:hypothetical protein